MVGGHGGTDTSDKLKRVDGAESNGAVGAGS